MSKSSTNVKIRKKMTLIKKNAKLKYTDAPPPAAINKETPAAAPLKYKEAPVAETPAAPTPTATPTKKLKYVDPSEAKTDATPSPKAPVTPGTAVSYRNSIVEMQQRIINLHKTLSADPSFGKGKGTTISADQSDHNPFLNFIFDNYMSSQSATQHDLTNPNYAKDDTREKGNTQGFGKSQKGKEAYDIRKVIDSLQAVGVHTTQQAEAKPDGDWGPRTNAALNNVVTFANTIFNLQKDLGLKSTKLSQEDIQAIQKNVPAKDTEISGQEKAQRAAILSQLIERVNLGFNEFKEQVFNNKDYKALIDQSSKFPTKIGGGVGKTLSPQDKLKEVEMAKAGKSNKNFTYINRDLTVGPQKFDNTNFIGLPLSIFTNKDNFIKFLKEQQITIDGKPAWSSNESILKVINKFKQLVSTPVTASSIKR